MKTDELREAYLSFFQSKGCTRRPSDVLVPRADPTVLFTPAGMNQFKEQFLDASRAEFKTATTCQKCLRTGDIENVGVTPAHHSFFEMLGNFSFGDYFKAEAIAWAWEFLTDSNWLGLDPDRLSVTVYRDDDEAFGIWEKSIGIRPERITREDEKENFWPASAPSQGPDGVCGPCSEIYYHPAKLTGVPDNEAGVEIWNLVFTQFNRVGDPPDNLKPLPSQNIDTGMGLERTAAVLQGKRSNFEIDTLLPLCGAAGEAVGKSYSFEADHGRAVRRIADHVRAVTMCMHEGVNPGKDKASYVVRLLLRRAAMEGYLLGQTEPFLFGLVPAVVESLKAAYPDVAETARSVADGIRDEESQFLETLERGLAKFEKVAGGSGGTISGRDLFTLHTQDGFLFEVSEMLAAKRGLSVDREGFKAEMARHEELSGSGAFADSVMSAGPLDAIRSSAGDSRFLGYDAVAAEGTVVGLIVDGQSAGEAAVGSGVVGVVLGQTPFYGEAGGQVGDTGMLQRGGKTFIVEDTQKDGGLTVHLGRVTNGPIAVGDVLDAEVDVARRAGIRRAHSATHILHHALHQTLGKDAVQRGSKVQQDELRFDFSHGQSVTPDELTRIEDIINERVSEGASVVTELMDIESARSKGAMALFGEKYPDRVRVVQMGEFSTELCGGTHAGNTGQIGLVRLVGEDAVAKGVRRISALTGPRALQTMRENERLLKEAAASVKAQNPADIPAKVAQLQADLKAARAELSKAAAAGVGELVDRLLGGAETVGDAKIITHLCEGLDRDAMRDLADRLRKKGDVCVLLGAEFDGKASLLAAVSKDLTKRGVKAGDCVREAAKVVSGGGGGRPDLAEAGGKDPSKLTEALEVGFLHFSRTLTT